MSLCFLGRCALTGLIAVSAIGAAFSQSASTDRAISANDLARAVVANELKAQDGSHSRWIYRLDSEEQGKKKAKEVVQASRVLSTDWWQLTDAR
jgi:hypothetical protein